MSDMRELLQDADPIRHEARVPAERREAQRRAILAATSADERRTAAVPERRSRMAFMIAVAAIAILGLFLGERLWSPLVPSVHAAIRFEIRLAEDRPGAGLHEVKISGDRSIYLHEEAIVTNSDISAARVIPVGNAYNVGLEFNKTGAQKMREATEKHIGKPIAILLDGRVVMAPVLRFAIGTSAEITDDFTKAEAEKVANGILGTP